ncbi:sigma 54-interacting transcriptional regulator [Candidatus Enterococcus ferrettii]|uniref:Uncharacterized protein n=1 Tax=Candidatus Enterococcus ferrettii TaxID=2815324 RepID=A0ABV0EVS0_9ENTE|nr:sigma 54-interacting transcriptional regulator [Enterococcus sp. 665A]MBO1341215.1 sigma 54-interacting transcriptional regulator [Enterococcus sp. 665A]
MREQIVKYVRQNTKINQKDKLLISLETKDITDSLGFERTRVSKVLNQEVNEGRFLKVKGKPVKYIYNFLALEQTTWRDVNDLWKAIFSHKKEHKEDAKLDAFSKLIGYDGSLSHAVNQAKAAILYPPRGIHTLITGPSGVGKTTFAKTMHEYALDIGQLEENAPYVYYNCADYAGNSQLLLSFLFGHVKGAFTGADKEKSGLVDAANGGILFLDEIHRLPPEGQEMLFSILDNGTFRRLGENNNEQHQVDLLLIGATTENVDESILATFRRRIPNVIHLEGLKSKKTEERFQLIESFFKYESTKIQNQMNVHKDVIKFFCIYDCVGNIGQLKNDIQMICARAFAEAIISDAETIEVTSGHMQMNEEQRILFAKEKRNAVVTSNFLDSVGSQIFSNGKNISRETIGGKSLSIDTYQEEQVLYQSILNMYSEMASADQAFETTDIKRKLEEFFSIELPVDNKAFQLGKIISPEVFDGVKELFDRVSKERKLLFDNQVRYSLALHIESVKVKLKSGRLESPAKTREKKYSDRFGIYQIVYDSLGKHINIKLPDHEILAICMFLEAVQVSKQNNGVGVLIVMHGDSTGSSMAKVANDLLDCDHAKAIDMRLTDSFTDIVELVIKEIKKENYHNGLLLLVDMGSLVSLDRIVSERTGLNVKLISSVSTPIVLEATRKSLLPGMTVNELIKQIAHDAAYLEGAKAASVISAYKDEKKDLAEVLRYDARIFELIKDSTNFIETKKSIPLINEAISKICSHLKLVITDAVYIKMQFHCHSMIERGIRKEPLVNPRTAEDISQHAHIYKVLRTEMILIENAYTIKLSDDEMAYLIEIIINLEG